MSQLGVSVQEGVSTGITPFQETSKYNVGLLMERERGIPNVPIRVTSLQEDRRSFGGLQDSAFGAYVTRHIFKNAGNFGASIYGVRILDEDNSSAAEANFTDGASSPTTIFTIHAGQLGLKDPGVWANDSDGVRIRCFPIDHPNGIVGKYLFEVYYKNRVVETFEAASWSSLITFVNSRSYYVMLTPDDLDKDISDIQEATLSGGTYGAPSESDYYPVSDESNPKGLAVLDTSDIQILAVAEHHTSSMAMQGRDYSMNHQNKPMFVYNLPYLSTSAVVESFANSLQTTESDTSAGYNFWVKTSDGGGGNVWTPSLGVIIGAGFIRVPSKNRDFLHYAPAGLESVFLDVIDISPVNLSRSLATTWVKRYSTNVATYSRGAGFFLFSSRTNSTNSLYQSIHTRRLMSFYGRNLETNLLWLIQKPITPELKRQAYVSIYSYFLKEYGNGALENSIDFDQACVIDVGQDSQDRKVLKIVIDIILTEVTESIRIELNRNDNSLVANVNV